MPDCQSRRGLLAHYESFHSDEVAGFSDSSGDLADGEGTAVVDCSDGNQTVEGPAEEDCEEVMELDDSEDDAPWRAIARLPWSKWEGGVRGRRAWLRRRGTEL